MIEAMSVDRFFSRLCGEQQQTQNEFMFLVVVIAQYHQMLYHLVALISG